MKVLDYRLLLPLVFVALFVNACSHPDDDARAAAAKFNKCQSQFVEKLQKDKSQFVNEFDACNYNYRESAENELIDILHEDVQKYERDVKAAQKIHDEFQKKYKKSTRKKFQFNNVFLMSLDDVDFSSERAIANVMCSESVVACMQQLLPLRPKIRQICRDLERHELVERGDDHYFNDSWKLVIGEDCVEKLEITDSVKTNKQWKYGIRMRVKDGGHYFNAIAEIVYTLNDDEKDWELTDVISQELIIAKTQLYRSSIPTPKVEVVYDYVGTPEYTNVTITSTCDSPLLVGGRRWLGDDRGWETFVIYLDALDLKTIQCGYKEDEQQVFKIDFVERQ